MPPAAFWTNAAGKVNSSSESMANKKKKKSFNLQWEEAINHKENKFDNICFCKPQILYTSMVWRNSNCQHFILQTALMEDVCCCLRWFQIYCHLLSIGQAPIKGALCSCIEDIQTQSCNFRNNNEIIIETLFHNWINKLFSGAIKVPRTLFQARKVAGSAKFKLSKTVWKNSFVLKLSLEEHHMWDGQ